MHEKHPREEAIFEGALQLPPDERESYLMAACGGEVKLIERIRDLIRFHEKSDGPLETPAVAPPPKATIVRSLPPGEKPGDKIGNYKILQLIGEGGCGSVYMAEQQQPVRRRVALKVIKLGMDTKNVIARFEAERQALALMDHPNIAKVFDAGATETGRPFFVMELVRGIKITEYCDQNNLSTNERLKLFKEVCKAIQHAHQKGIIHRDIKPSNILVTQHDGVPVPKVIDFGIAKATDQRLTDKTVFTEFEQFIGTPSYMTRSRIRHLIPVRDAVRDCLRAQMDGSPEERVVETRQQLNLAYDRFVGRFGPVNLRANQRAFDGDPDLPLLLSLENYNDETKRATKATIFTERTIHRRQPVESVGTPKEALLVTLNEHGRVDLDHMADLLNKPIAEFMPDLKGVIFLNPQTNQWETDDQYLSGNVREKLSVADAASVTDPRFAENVEALKSVQPADLAATEIDVRLGAAWLPPEDVQKFTNELLNIPSGVEIGHIHALGAWHINPNWEARGATANTTDWGTDRYTALELIEDALNLKTPTVYDTVDKKPVVNAQATEAAREKQERIKEKFKEWIWTDDSRRERLCRLYNDTFNHTRVRTFNGDHLTLPGASGAIQLHAHQKAGVWRILQTPNTLLAHVVGAGKTYTMVAAGMESRRLGISGKPMFVVPNHMLGQFSTELLTLYPGANILAAGKEDFESLNRKKLFSRIATGNWDAVIVTHSGFERIPLSRETQERFFKEQLHELEMIKRQHADSSNRRLVKELEKAKKRLEAKLQTLAAEHKKDNTLTFEELGVDRLFVDEAHYFKNLFYVTKMTRVAGLPQTASERAFDMFLKVRHIQSLNGGGGVVFATGTPIANSMAEMFTMQRYLQHEELKKHNLHHFDSWAATFGEPVTAMELSPDGAGYRLNTRFARFINVPELMQMFRQSADVQTAAMLNLPRPKLDGEKPTIRNAPATEELKEFVQSLAARAERLKTGRVDPSEDNMLKITSEGRKAALDLRLMKPAAPDEPQGKVNLAVEKIFNIWQESKPERSAQLVFCDLSTPKDKGFSVYNDMAQKLEKLGIPSSEIAFIQDYDSDVSKMMLFRDVRAGKVRVLFGSTQKMGSGTNVQERLSESFLRKPLRVAANFRSLRPSVAIGVQRNPVDSQPHTALVKLRGAVATTDGLQIGKQPAGCRHLPQNGFNVRAKMNHGQTAGFLPRVGDGLVGPVNVLRLEIGDVGLRTAEMPAQFVKTATLRVLLAFNDELMFLKRDGALGLKFDFRPKPLGNERPRQPVHRKAEIVQFPQMNVRADRARLEAGE